MQKSVKYFLLHMHFTNYRAKPELTFTPRKEKHMARNTADGFFAVGCKRTARNDHASVFFFFAASVTGDGEFRQVNGVIIVTCYDVVFMFSRTSFTGWATNAVGLTYMKH